MLELLRNAGLFALMSLAVSTVPMFMGIAYAVRPSEGRLALMRPLSLAGLFAGLAGLMSGLVNVLRGVGMRPDLPLDQAAIGVSESLIALFVAFGCLTVGWLCVALGMTRQP